MRLANHLLLGSSVSVHLHDIISTSRITFKWLKVATGYSSNVKLDVSPDVLSAISRLAELSFIIPKVLNLEVNGDLKFMQKLVDRHNLMPYTPMTYYYVLQSMIKRCVWLPGVAESLFLAAIPPQL